MQARIWKKRTIDRLAALLLCGVAATLIASPPARGQATYAADAAALPAPLGPTTNAPPATVVRPAKIALPPQLAEIVRLAESGLSDEVLIAYIDKSDAVYPISADEILYLRDLGISSSVLAVLLEHRAAAQGQAAQSAPPPTVPQLGTETNPANLAEQSPTDLGTGGAAGAPAIVDDNSFYNELSPYGTWLELPGYGWCWQPTVVIVNGSWLPYCDGGRWLWSDCGWYWNSYYSWGWAPFHYGRWCRYPRYGWVWCPDRVWARLGSAGATRQTTLVGPRCRRALVLPLESVGPTTGRAWEQTPVSASRRLLSPLFPSTTLLTGICPTTAWTHARSIPFSALRQ